MKSKKARQPAGDVAFDIANNIFVALCVLAVIYPLIYIVSASFSSPPSVVSGKVWLLPVKPTLIAYETIFKYRQILVGYGNAVFYTVAGTLVGVIVNQNSIAMSADDMMRKQGLVDALRRMGGHTANQRPFGGHARPDGQQHLPPVRVFPGLP